jgi:hypothetical protein
LVNHIPFGIGHKHAFQLGVNVSPAPKNLNAHRIAAFTFQFDPRTYITMVKISFGRRPGVSGELNWKYWVLAAAYGLNITTRKSDTQYLPVNTHKHAVFGVPFTSSSQQESQR